MTIRISLRFIAGVLAISAFVTGCQKLKHLTGADQADNCADIQKMKLISPKSHYLVGDTIRIGVTVVANGYYEWHVPSSGSSVSGGPTYEVDSCSKKDQGSYYLSVSDGTCSNYDSIQVTVTNKPVPAPCTLADNTVSFKGYPTLSTSYPTWRLDQSSNTKDLGLNDNNGDFFIHFDPYWATREPEDGIYRITTDFFYSDVYSVSMDLTTYGGSFLTAKSRIVYVSHVNNKVG
jgi:hypothetical protein